MAICVSQLEWIAPKIKGRVLALGYPDILATPEDIERIFGKKVTKFTNHGKWHRYKTEQIPDTRHLFELIDAELSCVDIAEIRGGEIVADLNQPQVLGEFDFVLNPGTIEHCFNIAQAMENASRAVRVGGHIYHSAPMTHINHGFYNLNPTFFYDYYLQNQWFVERCVLSDGKEEIEAPHFKRFKSGNGIDILCLAKRTAASTFHHPMQEKYRMHPTLTREAA